MMFGLGGGLFQQDCNVCGAAMGDVEVHREWHNAMNEIIRKVIAPDMSDEEWEKFMAGTATLREAAQAVRREERRAAADDAMQLAKLRERRKPEG